LLGFHCRDDVREIHGLLTACGVEVAVCAPLGASPEDLRRLPVADFNVVLYPEIARSTATWLQKTFGQPFVDVVPIGVRGTRAFLERVGELAGIPIPEALMQDAASRLPWYSRSVDSTYLTGKRVFVFGDGAHALAAARVARDELGFAVVGIGTYSREMAREVRAEAAACGVEALITDDYLEVERHVASLAPELVLGTQMERHIAKRLGVPCAVISSPNHVQDVPARYSPQMGFEGANVLFDTWVHPLMMGLEEHLLHLFRDDFEFRDDRPSHVGVANAPVASPIETVEVVGVAPEPVTTTAAVPAAVTDAGDLTPAWEPVAERELARIPFFVRGKARRNTERYARERGLPRITLETLYDAKAHFGR
jgi:light-independent protochlorophyllide reductase subunit B